MISPTAKIPGILVSNFSVSTASCLRSISKPHSAIGPNLGESPKNTSKSSSGIRRVTPSAPVTLISLSLSSLVSKPETCPITSCISYASHNSFIFATDAGAARKSSRRCNRITDSALPCRLSAQSSAESPPPQITILRPAKRAGSFTR